MWLLIVITLLWLASDRWPAFGFFFQLCIGVLGIIGLIILTKGGFVAVYLQAVFEIPVNLVVGVFGVIKHLLYGEQQ